MGRLSVESRKRVITLRSKGYSVLAIRRRLKDENVIISRQAIYNLFAKFQKYRMLKDLPVQRRKQKITEEMKSMIEESLNNNDEITARGIKSLLIARWPELQVSIPTIKRVRKDMEWVCTRPHYCQLRPVSLWCMCFISNYCLLQLCIILSVMFLCLQLNKRKRLMWCKEQLRSKEDFKNVIFADECSVQLEHHSRTCFHKRFQPRKLKQRAKHPVKIHIWGGIYARGATRKIMFSGIMNAKRLAMVLEVGLLPFITEKFSDGHRLFHDNDPKHASEYIEDFFKRHNVNWWPTPPESPDLNPIENI